MKIEIGKTYPTKNGCEVEITERTNSREYPFQGVVTKGNEFLYTGAIEVYTEDGQWLRHVDGPEDLIIPDK